jgi:hypothetical protein
MTSDIAENGPAACFSLDPLILFVNQSTFLIGACLIRLFDWAAALEKRSRALSAQAADFYYLFGFDYG